MEKEPDGADVEAGRLVLGRYTVLGKLTQGGMAEVYLARQKGPAGYSKLVVIKRVRPNLANDKDFVAMFVNEARLAALINHPNVVQIFDLGQDKRDWFLAMEFLDGRDMLQVGRACRGLNKAVPFDVTARIIADACAGLEHAHRLVGADGKSLNLVHRDMSPENILITFEGQVKVVDFGIAKARDNAFRTQAGQIKGKLGYVAPEAILGKPLDGRADIFAMGATLYLFLCGRPAFTGSNPMEIFERSLQPPEAPTKINPKVPPALAEICVRCLEREPDKRYRSAGDLRIALEGYLHEQGRPMSGPQLSQFMKILFPGDKDPIRQRIEQLINDGNERDESERLSFLSAETKRGPQKSSLESALASSQASVPEEDPDDTHVVPPEERPDRPTQERAPPAVDLASSSPSSMETARAAAYRPTPTPPVGPKEVPRAPSYPHLRSVELASQLDAQKRKATPAPQPRVDVTQATRPQLFDSEPSAPPVARAAAAPEGARGEMTVELDPSLLSDLRASSSPELKRVDARPSFARDDDDGPELDDVSVEVPDLDEMPEVTHPGPAGPRVETAHSAPPPPLDPDAFEPSVEVAALAHDSLDDEPALPPPASAEDIGLSLSPISSVDGEATDPEPRLLEGSGQVVSEPTLKAPALSPALDFADAPYESDRPIVWKKASLGARLGMLAAGMLTGLVVVAFGLWALGEIEWAMKRMSAAPAESPTATATQDPS